MLGGGFAGCRLTLLSHNDMKARRGWTLTKNYAKKLVNYVCCPPEFAVPRNLQWVFSLIYNYIEKQNRF